MNLTLKVWRQKNSSSEGKLENYSISEISPDMSFLEMLDVVNEKLIHNNQDPIAFEHDCREGICGSCGVMINGRAHGPGKGVATCQLHMRSFKDGDAIVIEPWRAVAFPVVKDLVVNRSAMDRIIQSGGYVSVNTGGVPDANEIPIPKVIADEAFEAATCIGCGACVAACKNASAALFTSAKVAHLNALPQGKAEAGARVINMLDKMDEEGFGSCTNTGACEAVCPKEISVKFISRMNRQYLAASFSPTDN
ncbi:MAG: succinate dehydrogenase / fumarate reductase iron-sulfur subunit [Sphingobacteriales bacterium]|jgi:succinate dehydrogenase / fumarate reductase iron-sulfur subunit